VLSSSFHTIPNILKNLRSLVCLQVLFSSGPTLDKRHGDWVTFDPKDATYQIFSLGVSRTNLTAVYLRCLIHGKDVGVDGGASDRSDPAEK